MVGAHIIGDTILLAFLAACVALAVWLVRRLRHGR
jgi:hypothetical protein